MKKIIIIVLLLFPLLVLAENQGAGGGPAVDPNCPSGTPAGSVCIGNPLGTDAGKTSIPTLLGNIISSVLGVVGSLALVMFIYGGITWMLSAGNQERVTKGKQILIWATIGIVIIFTAYALVKFVIEAITKP